MSRTPYLNVGFEFLIVDVNGIVVVVLGPSSQQAVSHLNIQQVVQHLDFSLNSDAHVFRLTVPQFMNNAKNGMTQCFFTYLNVVQVVEQWRFFHPKVMRDQSVEAIGQVQDVGIS